MDNYDHILYAPSDVALELAKRLKAVRKRKKITQHQLAYSDTYWGEQTTSVCGKGKDISEKELIKAGTDAGLSKAFCIERLNEIRDKRDSLRQYLGKY